MQIGPSPEQVKEVGRQILPLCKAMSVPVSVDVTRSDQRSTILTPVDLNLHFHKLCLNESHLGLLLSAMQSDDGRLGFLGAALFSQPSRRVGQEEHSAAMCDQQGRRRFTAYYTRMEGGHTRRGLQPVRFANRGELGIELCH